ncbi:MAG: hypothetical protein ACYC8T_07505 [Myxococcaceae bacterium]
MRALVTGSKTWDAIEIEDGRGGEPVTHRVKGPAARLYEACLDARRREDLAGEFKDQGEQWLDATLGSYVGAELMVFVDERYLALALPLNSDH